jgi:hypothetical protein
MNGRAHKLTRANDFNRLAALSRNFLRLLGSRSKDLVLSRLEAASYPELVEGNAFLSASGGAGVVRAAPILPALL